MHNTGSLHVMLTILAGSNCCTHFVSTARIPGIKSTSNQDPIHMEKSLLTLLFVGLIMIHVLFIKFMNHGVKTLKRKNINSINIVNIFYL